MFLEDTTSYFFDIGKSLSTVIYLFPDEIYDILVDINSSLQLDINIIKTESRAISYINYAWNKYSQKTPFENWQLRASNIKFSSIIDIFFSGYFTNIKMSFLKTSYLYTNCFIFRVILFPKVPLNIFFENSNINE